MCNVSACRYFTFLEECKDPKACTILLRGASKDILNEVERNLQDAMNVTRNVMLDAMLVPGGGAVEMALAQVSSEEYICFKPPDGSMMWEFGLTSQKH